MSKISPFFLAKVNELGELIIDNIVLYKQYLLNLKNSSVTISIKKYRNKNRSLNQNSYYHGVVLFMLSNHLGYTQNELHDALKIKFLPNKTEKGLIIYKTTSDLTTAEFEEYMIKIREWASSYLNFYIPQPNEVNY